MLYSFILLVFLLLAHRFMYLSWRTTIWFASEQRKGMLILFSDDMSRRYFVILIAFHLCGFHQFEKYSMYVHSDTYLLIYLVQKCGWRFIFLLILLDFSQNSPIFSVYYTFYNLSCVFFSCFCVQLLLFQLLRGLQFIHKKKILHRYDLYW